jgi:hypothetical protein
MLLRKLKDMVIKYGFWKNDYYLFLTKKLIYFLYCYSVILFIIMSYIYLKHTSAK